MLNIAPAAVFTFVPNEQVFSNLDQIELKNVYFPVQGNIKLAPKFVSLCSLDDAGIWSIDLDRSQNIYLGTGNQQRLYRLGARARQPQPIFSADAGEILTVTTTPDNTIYFGTSPDGIIYRILPRGEPESLFATNESYIHALLPAPEKSLLCATGPNGKLFRITPDRGSDLIFTAPSAHITCLYWLSSARELLLGTSPGGTVYHLKFTSIGAKPEVAVLYDTPLDEVRAIVADSRSIYVAANPGEQPSPNPGPNQPVVYCLDKEGLVKWQWLCPESVVFSLTQFNNQLLVLTGNRGIVYTLDSLGQPAVICRLNEPQAVACISSNNRLYLGTANPARLYYADFGFADSGFVTSPVFDCSSPARFGKIELRARVPAGTEIHLDTRSGNRELPDSLWTNWQEAKGKIASPPARFIQWRCRLYSNLSNASPELERVDIYYQGVNRPPVISRLEINPVSEPDARRGNAQPKRQITWEAQDPDYDSLVYQLYLKPEEETSWLELKKDLAEPRYELDTRTIPDGWYRLRLVALDAPDRPEKIALSAERVSLPFAIDNTPPVISEIGVSGNRASWKVSDNLSTIVACRISINAGDWQPLEPEDGIFDSSEERFSTTFAPIKGINTIAVWATDAQGNAVTRRASFTSR
ncbi:MAG: hypothetical protein ABIK18_00290 [candidate division WOR-3 bacterium]